jgi:membrane dipeptidase
MMDRRTFLASVGAAGAAFSLSGILKAQAPGPRPGATRSIWIDAQGGINGFEERDGQFVVTERFRRAVSEGRMDAISTTLGEVGNGPDRFEAAVNRIAWWNRRIAENPSLLMRIERGADLAAARASRRLGVIYNFQDTTPLEGDVANVQIFRNLGVRVMQLTYNKRNLAGDGCLERSNAGLSDFGRQAIAAINEAKLLLDLSHAGQRTIAEGIAEAKAPPVISHSGCRALVDFPRNVHDAEMRALANKGGVIGIYLMPFLRPQGQAGKEDLLRHLDHAVNVCGEDHVGIGTDGPLFGIEINDAARTRQREFYERRARLGIAAPGEAPDVFNIVMGYNDITRFDSIAADLSARGWSSARIDKVLGGNFARLYTEVWG